jgi:hypothetical protein
MSDEFDPDLLPGHCLRELRFMAADHGYRFADCFEGDNGFTPIGQALHTAGMIEPGMRGRIRTWELTAAGRAWLAANGAGS